MTTGRAHPARHALGNRHEGETIMKRLLVAAALSLPLAACYTPADPALTGAVVGGATGAAIGGAATGRAGGALVGGALGATTGAIIGASARPRVTCTYDPYYGVETCY
jgi:hypothetical protein